MKYLILLLFFVSLHAKDNYSFRVAYGVVTSSDLGEILVGNIKSHEDDLRVFAVDGGYLLKEKAFEIPLDFYLKAGYARFFEDGFGDDINEVTLYFKAYWNFDFLKNRVRLGIGEGFSYTSDILRCEYLEATEKEDHYSRFLNYLDLSVDFDFGKLIRYKPLYNTYVGWTIKHRSGVFGLINDVSHGGSNYNTISIERNF